MNKKTLFLYSLAAMFTFTACTNEDLPDGGKDTTLSEPVPLELTAAIGEVTATRGSAENNWDGGETIHVQVSDNADDLSSQTPLIYIVDADGKMTLKDGQTPVLWEDTGKTFYIRAWRSGKGEEDTSVPAEGNQWTVQEDQSTQAGLNKSDFLVAYRTLTWEQQRAGRASLQFTHLPARVSIRLKPDDYFLSTPAEDVSVTLKATSDDVQYWWNLDGTFSGTTDKLTMTAAEYGNNLAENISCCRLTDIPNAGYVTYAAILPPQSTIGGTREIEIKVGSTTYKHTIDRNYFKELKSGYDYLFILELDAQGLTSFNITNKTFSWNTGTNGSGTIWFE